MKPILQSDIPSAYQTKHSMDFVKIFYSLCTTINIMMGSKLISYTDLPSD